MTFHVSTPPIGGGLELHVPKCAGSISVVSAVPSQEIPQRPRGEVVMAEYSKVPSSGEKRSS